MNDKLIALRQFALKDPALRQALLETGNAEEPLTAFCSLALRVGIDLTPEEVIGDGEEFSSNQTKSTNGGNPLPYECFDDAYEMFLMSIQ